MRDRSISFTRNSSGLYFFIHCVIFAIIFFLIFFVIFPERTFALTDEELSSVTSNGWQEVDDGSYAYMLTKKKPAKGFRKIGDYWYHFDDDGYLSLGWFKEDNYKYFGQKKGVLGKTLGKLKSGYVKIYSNYYLFLDTDVSGEFGRMVTGWGQNGKNVYYFSEKGLKLTGLQKIGKYIYYFQPSSNAKKNGKLVTGWKKLDSKRYFFRTSGKIGKKYGAAYVSTTVKINNIKYTFDDEGAMTGVVATTANEKFIERIGKIAKKNYKSSGIIASIVVAQAICESEFGQSELAVKAKNLFGMKANLSGNSWGSIWNGKTYSKMTLEYLNGSYVYVKASFRKYSSWKQSIKDHSLYLANAELSSGKLRYSGIVGCTNYKKALKIIYKGGYATAKNYVSSLIAIIEKYDLTRFDD